MEEIQTETDKLVKESLVNQKKIILYNDPINTFEHVINCLIKYCKHSSTQSEQISTIVHYNGKCDIKQGDFDTLLPIYTALLDNQLKVEIE